MSGRAGGVLPRLAGGGGLAWGAALLARGDRVWTLLERRDPDAIEELAIRTLGGRHLVQGVAQLVAPRATAPSQAAPSRRRHNPITRCRAHLDYGYAGTDDETRAPTQPLTPNTSP